MDYKYINQLLDRYWQGETTLEEEAILRTFFSQEGIPAELQQYAPLFRYEQSEPATDVLGDDFDERILALIDEPTQVKARVITMRQRLMPLFKAAAVVAIILTLGNAMQVPFNERNAFDGTSAYEKPRHGVSVAMTDSARIDSIQHSSIDQSATPANLLK